MTAYYDLVLSQANRSFNWALLIAGLGFVFFLAAAGFALMRYSQDVAAISLIGGLVMEIVAAINFYLYGKTSSRLAEFHAHLDVAPRYLVADSICEELEGPVKQRARVELVRKIADIRPIDHIVRATSEPHEEDSIEQSIGQAD